MPETVLVVEDEPGLLETLAYNLKSSGYRVVTAADGKRGLEEAQRVRPEPVISTC